MTHPQTSHMRSPGGTGWARLWVRTWTRVAAVLALLVAWPAGAVVVGTYPSTPKAWKVYGKSVQLGASLVTNTVDYRFNDKLLAQSSDTVKISQKMPEDAVIVAAYLFWGGSEPDSGYDNTASLTLADGSQQTLAADGCETRTDPSPNGTGSHYYCRRDVTSLVQSHPGGDHWNGSYTVGGINAKVANIKIATDQSPCPFQKANGQDETVCCVQGDGSCQARHASWTMVFVYDTKYSEATQRDVFLYDGVVLLDEQATSLGQISFTINNFLVADPPDAQLTFYAMEGDEQLGNPAQTPGNTGPDSPPCDSCFDFIQFNGTKLTGGAGNNDADNIMNSTPETGMDLDSFDVSPLVQPNDTSANLLVSSGDGKLSNNFGQANQAGNGEFFVYGWTLLQVNRKAPNYKSSVNKLFANFTEASPGDVISYTSDLLNTGPVDSDNTVLKMNVFPPTGTDYVPGSTYVDGVLVPDVGGQSALQAGLNLGTLTNPAGGKSNRTVTFKVKIKAAPGVIQIDAQGTVSYSYVNGTYTDSVQTTTSIVKLVPPTLAPPSLAVAPAKQTPGGTVTYTLTLQSLAEAAITVDSASWDLPTELVFVSATGPGTNKSSGTGGGAGAGQVRFEAVPIASGQQAIFTVTAKIKDVAGLQAAGIAQINGHTVSLQGTVTLGQKSYKTDDPNVTGAENPTTLTIQTLSNLVNSTKTVTDLSPGTQLLPGDQVKFTINIQNTGLGDATVNVSDPVPSGLAFVSSQSPELTLNGTVLTGTVLVPAGTTKSLSFTAQIKADTAPGQTFQNVATLAPTDGQAPTVVQTPLTTVEGGPDLATSLLTVQDVNAGDLEPGDTLTYTLTWTNTGKVTTGPLQIVLPLDKSLEGVTAVDGGGSFDVASGNINWNSSGIATGATLVLHFSAKVKAVTPNGTAIVETATASGPQLGKVQTISATVKVQANPNITTFSNVASSSGITAFNPGDTVTYTLVVQNTGKGAVTNGVITTLLDPALGAIVPGPGGTVSGQTVTWNVGTLATGDAAKQVTVTAKLATPLLQGKAIANQASLTGEGLGAPVLSDDPAKPGKTDPTVFAITSAPNLTTSTKSYTDSNGGGVQGGDKLTFVIKLQNTGNSPATNVVVTDILAPQLTQVQVTGGSFNAGTSTVTWNALPSVAPGDKVELTVTAVVDKNTPSGTTITNQAKLAFAETPSSAVTNTISFVVINLPDFGASTKTVSAAQIPAGGAVTYTINIVNSGNQAGTGVVATDVLPLELENVSVGQGGTFNATTRTATWSLGSVAAGATTTVTVNAAVKKPLDNALQVCNQARIKANENPTSSQTSPPDTPLTPAGTPTCFAVVSAPVLSFQKNVFASVGGTQLNQATVKPKTALTWQLKVRNTGNALAKQLQVTDLVPAGMENIVPLDGGTLDATGKITWPQLAQLGIGTADEAVYRFTATVKSGLDDGTALQNQGLLTTAAQPTAQKSDDPTTPATGDPTVVSVQSKVDLTKTKLTVVDVNGGDVRPGDALTYTLVVRNDGDGSAKATTVTLPLDPRLGDFVVSGNGTVQGAGTPGGTATWALGTLVPGDAITLTIQAKVKVPQLSGAQLVEQAQVTATGLQAPVLSDADLTTAIREPTTVVVVATADLSPSHWVVQDVNGGVLEPGDAVVLTLLLQNKGDALAQLLAVQAQLPAVGLTDVNPFDGGVLTGTSVAWTVPTVSITPTGDVALRVGAKIAAGTLDGTLLTATAQIPGVAQNPTITLKVVAQPNLSTSVLTADDENGWVQKFGQAAPGHVIRTELRLKNTGQAVAQNVTATLPLGPKWTGITPVTPGNVVGGVVTWTVASIPPGGTVTLTAKATIGPTAQDGDALPLAAQVKAENVAAVQNVVGPTLTVANRAILTVQKAYTDLDAGHVVPGDKLKFSVTVANVGNVAAQNVQISDVLPAQLTGAVVQSGGTLQGTTASWTVPTLAVGQSATVTLEATIAAGTVNGAVIANQAKAKANNAVEAPSNVLNVTVKFPTLVGEVKLIPEAPATVPAQPGDTVTLQVIVSVPTAENATGVVVTVPVDATVFDVTQVGGATWDPAAKTLTWTVKNNAGLGNIPGGAALALSATLKVKATATNGAKADGKAKLTEGETGLSYDAKPTTLAITAVPKLKLQKTVSDLNGGKVNPLDVVRYTIVVSVTGQAAADGVVVQDELDPALEVVSVGQGGKQTTAGGKTTIAWTAAASGLAAVVPGESASLTFDARIRATTPDGAIVPNQATVKANAVTAPLPSDDPGTPAIGDATLLTVRTESALGASTKTGVDDNAGALLPGETVTWRVRVVGTAPTALSNARLIDPMPAGMTYEPGSTTLNGQPVADVGGQSAVVAGMRVTSPGQAPGTLLTGVENAAVVTFRTRLRADAGDMGQVSNTATAVADNVAPTLVGPATLAVGKGPSLRQTVKTAKLVDSNQNGQADVGEAIAYTITVPNTGAGRAEGAALTDAIPGTARYLPGSLAIDGKALTDVPDGDAGQVDAKGTVSVALGALDPSAQRVVTFQAKILGGISVSNQASVVATGMAPELSDADADDSNGNQPTVTPVGPAAALLAVQKSVQDENGGNVQAGDWLRYTIHLQNLGNAKADAVTVTDVLPKGLDALKDGDVLLPPGAVLQNDGATLKATGLQILAAESATISLRVRVAGAVAEGATLCNIAKVDVVQPTGEQHLSSKPACVTAGAVIGEGAIGGTIFEDVGADDGVYQPETDLRFANFQVAVLPPVGVDGAVLTAIADANGQYSVLHVPEGPRRVRVLSPGGAVFLERTISSPGANSGKLDLAVKPTGRVYNVHSGELQKGVRLWLRYDEMDPVAPNGLLPDDALPPGQQGQTTDVTGAYQFSPPAGRAYRLEVASVATGYAFPPAGHAPEAGIALLDKQGLVVEDALPRPSGNTAPKYITRFSLQGATVADRTTRPAKLVGPPSPRHNHLPVESLQSAIQVTVRFNKTQAQVGDLLYATVTVQNRSTAGFAADLLTGRGGVEIRDLVPSGLNLVPGAADLTLTGGSNGPVKVPLAPLSTPLMVVQRLSPASGKPLGLDLPPGGSLTMRAQLVVTPSAKPGQQLVFSSQLFGVGGQMLSDSATAQLLVQADPIFDRGMVLAKTYCDGNQNGVQDEGEDGLPGVRIYSDIGQYAATDAYGRAHLMDIPPGNHLFKVDPDTLPPGTTLIGDEQKVLYVTRGVTLALTFAAQCKYEAVGPTRVDATQTTASTAPPAAPGPGVVGLAVDAAALSLTVDQKIMAPRYLRAQLLLANRKPDVGGAPLAADVTSVAVEPGTPMTLHVEHTGGFARHALEIRELGEGGRLGALVVEQVDPRDPPRLLTLRARPGFPGVHDLTRGRPYVLRVRAETQWGSRVWSAPVPFEVRDRVTDPRDGAWQLTSRPARLLVNGNPFELDAEGRAALAVDRPADGKLLISVRQADGAGRDEFVSVAMRTGAASVPPPADSAANSAGPPVFGASLLDGLRAEVAASGPVATSVAPSQPPSASTLSPAAAVATGMGAAQLEVLLPPGPLELGQQELGIRGKTLPTNKVEVQGQPAIVDDEGRFYALVKLPVGASTLTIAATDKAGNRAIIERPVLVKERALFLLAIADGSVSHVGAHLQEIDQPGALAIGSTQLAGRVALYAKGRVSGQFLGLKDLSFTAHVDTAKDPNLQTFATNLIDPTRFYPVYGDASNTTQDVKARGQLYILVEADKTKFLIGNFQARLQGIELLRYDRTLYGAWLDITRSWGGADTTVRALVAQQDRMVQRHTDVMRGTGGSLYYLSSRDVVEGSERIDLVIRDRISGMELGRIPQTRNVDYVIDPMQGRITFKSPLSGAVDGTLLLGQTGLAGQNLTWNGHPLYLETTYESRGLQSTDALSFGGQVREKFAGGRVDMGGTYVQEGRADAPTYRAAGGDVTVKLGERSKVTGEYAFSQSRDTLLSVSDDGGLTFGQPTQATGITSAGQAVSGQAVKIAVDVDLRDLLGASSDPAPTDLPVDVSTANDRGRVRAWYQWVQAGYQSGGAIAQQGMQKAGIDTMVALSRRNTLQVRYDGLFGTGAPNPYSAPGVGTQFGNVGGIVGGTSVLPPGSLANQTANPNSSFLSLSQQMVSVQDTHKLNSRWTILGANTVSYGYNGAGVGHASDTIAAGAAFRVTENLILRADQQGILAGDDTQFRGAADRLSTAVGLEYKIAKDLAIVVNERVGWGGQNATSAGLRTMLDKSSSLYVQQRLEDTNATGRLVSSSVVGAESRYGDDQKSRAYGEYQIDALNAGRMNRAIMGLGKRFAIQPGLNLDAGYERQQTFAANGGNTGRDALSLGAEWLKGDWWKVTSRQEVRVDQGDTNFGGVRKWQILTLNNGQFGVTREWTLFGRANYTRTQNQTTDVLEAEALEATIGAAYRPITHNWLNVVAKLSHLIDMRPSTAGGGGTPERSVKDVISVEPVAQLPWRLEFSQKVAFRRVTESTMGLGPESSSTLLLVSRLGWHITDRIDLAAEYRFLKVFLTGDLQHGALLEAAWRFTKLLRVGGGYNFSSFTETTTGDIRSIDQGGFFMRLTGMY